MKTFASLKYNGEIYNLGPSIVQPTPSLYSGIVRLTPSWVMSHRNVLFILMGHLRGSRSSRKMWSLISQGTQIIRLSRLF